MEVFFMKSLLLSTAAVLFTASAALALPPVQYPPGSSPSAIAANEAARVVAESTGGVKWCLFIDTQDPHGRCLVQKNLDFGGPGGDGGAGASGGDGGAGAGGSK